MSGGEIILAAVALLIGLPAAWRNATAAALFGSWLFGVVMLYQFHHTLSKPEMFYCDLAVIAIIAAKPEECSLRPYNNLWHQVKCIMLERSIWDRRVIVLFLFAWTVYSIPLSPSIYWWSLFAIAVLQFIAAGIEAFTKWRGTRTTNANLASVPDIPPADLEFARPAWGGGYG